MGQQRIKAFLQEEKTEEKKILSLLADNTKEYNRDRMVLLGSLGLTKTVNFAEEAKAKESVDAIGQIMEEQEFLESIKKTFGDDVQLIKFTKLVQFCEEHNLFFGKADTFTGKIPAKVVTDITDFEFSRLDNYKAIKPKNTICNWTEIHESGEHCIFMASSPHNFAGTNALISNREVIASDFHSKLEQLDKNSYLDTIILSPIIYNKEIYFIIIKIW